MSWLLFLAATLSGISNPFQSGTNAQLNKQLGNPLWATAFVYASGLLGLLVAQVFARQVFPDATRIAGVSWWAWLGGLISVISTVAGLTLSQKLGSGVFTGASVTAALLTSVLLDHLGIIGFRQHTAGPGRLAGCALMVAGLWLISRF